MTRPSISPDWSKKGTYWFDLWDASARDDLYVSLVPPPLGTILSDDAAMFLAASSALKGVGCVSPNPLVGAVIVDKNGGFLASGAHLQFGKNHAEVNAIEQIKDPSVMSGGTIFVTLEPCAHVGKTPACARELAKLGLKRIVYSVQDPNPLVNGAGDKILRDAGKVVERASSWSSRCEWLTRVFLLNQRKGEIYTGMKVASTEDGVIAGEKTTRLWITGERARDFGHFLRLEYDAILIGLDTLLLDDPMLNVRHPHIKGRTPFRVVLDPRDQVRNDSRSFKMMTEEPGRTMIVCPGKTERSETSANGVHFLSLPLNNNGQFDFSLLKRHLWDRGIRSLLVEGGARTYESALSTGAVDAIHWFIGRKKFDNGLKWAIPEVLKNKLADNSALKLGEDRLIEVSLKLR